MDRVHVCEGFVFSLPAVASIRPVDENGAKARSKLTLPAQGLTAPNGRHHVVAPNLP